MWYLTYDVLDRRREIFDLDSCAALKKANFVFGFVAMMALNADRVNYLLLFLGEKNSVDVGQDTAGSDGHTTHKLVQFFTWN